VTPGPCFGPQRPAIISIFRKIGYLIGMYDFLSHPQRSARIAPVLVLLAALTGCSKGEPDIWAAIDSAAFAERECA
jgi:hypothetical protein